LDIVVRQLSQQDAVDDAEDRGRRSHRQGDGDDGAERERGRLAQTAEAVAHVAKEARKNVPHHAPDSLSTRTRLSWYTAPPPMSESRSSTVALTVVPPFAWRGQCPLVLATTPGRMRSLTSADATNEPRWLATRTWSPAAMP